MKKDEYNFMKDKKNIFLIITVVFLLTIIDIISKYLFTNKYLFEKFFISIRYSKNYGSSFGIFSNIEYYNYFVIILSIIVLFLLIKNYKYFFNKTENKHKKNIFDKYFLQLSFIFFISGILGNLYDRIIFGYVRDFISLKYLFIFNFADLFLTLSLLTYITYELLESRKKKKIIINCNDKIL